MSEPALPPDGVPVLRMSTPGEVLQAVPYLLGFHPTDSVVVLALRSPRGRVALTMRIDLPPPAGYAALASTVRDQLAQVRAERVLLVLYGGDPRVLDGLPHRDLVNRLCDELQRGRVGLQDALYVAGGRWWSFRCDDPGCCPAEGTPLVTDLSSTVAATAAYAGLVALPDRTALERTLRPVDLPARNRMKRAIAAAQGRPPDLTDPAAREQSRADVLGRIRVAVSGCVEGEGWLTDDEAASLLVWLRDVHVRDLCCTWAEGDVGQGALSLWIQLARRSVHRYDVAPLSLVAWVAWRRGNGVLARVAVERALASDATYGFARLIQEVLDTGVNPAVMSGWTVADGRAGAGRAHAKRSRS